VLPLAAAAWRRSAVAWTVRGVSPSSPTGSRPRAAMRRASRIEEEEEEERPLFELLRL